MSDKEIIGRIVIGQSPNPPSYEAYQGGLHWGVRTTPAGESELIVKPKIGQMVLFGSAVAGHLEVYPAIILKSFDDNTADLNVFEPGKIVFQHKAVFSQKHLIGCWSFL